MTIIDEIFETDIIAKLNEIEDISVLDGWLVHYAKDLLTYKNGLSFPCVAAQLGKDELDSRGSALQSNITRTVVIIGMVDVVTPELVNRKLNELVYKTRVALAVDKTQRNATKAMSIKLGTTKYDLPDAKDQYALFEMEVLITYNEKWDKDPDG